MTSNFSNVARLAIACAFGAMLLSSTATTTALLVPPCFGAEATPENALGKRASVASGAALLTGLHTSIAPFDILPAAARIEKTRLDSLVSSNETLGPPYQNGILRHLDSPLLVVFDHAHRPTGLSREIRPGGLLETTIEGDLVWTGHLQVDEAWQLRVGLSEVKLPPSALIWVYGEDGNPMGPVAPRESDPQDDLWLPAVSGASVWIEVRVSEKDLDPDATYSLSLARVTQVFPLDEQGRVLPASPGVTNLASWTMTGAGVDYVPEEVVVKFRTDVAIPGTERRKLHAGRTVLSHSAELNIDRIRSTSGESTVALLARYKQSPFVEYAEPNYLVNTTAIPNDPRYGDLYGLSRIDAPRAWDVETGSTAVVVADIDTGMDMSHSDLAPNMWTNKADPPDGIDNDRNGLVDDVNGWDFVEGDNTPDDCAGHGTHTAGTIAAEGNNGIGVVGVSWRSRIMPLRFLNCSGSGTSSNAAKAIVYAAKMGVRISSNSWGGGYSQAEEDAIAYARTKGMLFVVAAGNDGGAPLYPCYSTQANVLCVAATDQSDRLAYFSNRSATAVDLGAPGVGILSTYRGGTYATLSGTSMATPHVAGAAALLLSRYPALSVPQLKAMLMESTDPLPDLSGRTVTGGRLNVANALTTLPDLTLSSVATSAATTAAGAAVPVSTLALNRGNLASEPSVIAFSLSPNAVYGDADDIPVTATRATGALTVGQTISALTSLVVPATTPAGVYHLCARADATLQVVEADEANNGLCTSTTVYVQRPDLLVPYFSMTALSARPGAPIVVANSVANLGSYAAASSVVTFHLSVDQVYGGADDFIAATTRTIASLAVGATSVASTSVVIPATTPAGVYHLCAKADGNQTVIEINESNNTSCTQATIVISATDLTITSLATTTSVATGGGTVALANTITNQGGLAAGPFSVAFHLSTNAVYGDADDIPAVTTRAIASLTGGAASATTTSVVVPVTTPAGNYYLCARADVTGQVAESDEGNNTRCTATTVQVQRPDLIVTSLSTGDGARAGTSIIVLNAVTNLGNRAAGSSVVAFHLSRNAIYGDADDVVITTARTIASLAIGATSTASTTVVIPATTPTGTFYLCAKTDDRDAVVEINETNNTRCTVASIAIQP